MAINLQVTVNVDGKESVVKVFDQASDSARRFGQQAKQTKANWAEALTAVSTGFLAFKELADKVMKVFEEPIKLAMEQETANRRLAASLKLSGQYSDEAYAGMKEYAEQLEKATGVQNSLISSTLTTNQTFGLNTQQAKAATEAAIKLSKATGIDMATANDMLLQSLNGHDRMLKRVIPQVGSMTEAQLRAGDAIRLVQKQLETLNGTGDSTETAFNKIMRGLENLMKGAGSAFLKGLDLGGNGMKINLEALAATIKKLEPTFQSLGKSSLMLIVYGFEKMASALLLLDAIVGSGVANWLKTLEALNMGVTITKLSFNALGLAFAKVFDMAHPSDTAKNWVKNFTEDIKRNREELEESRQKIKSYGESAAEGYRRGEAAPTASAGEPAKTPDNKFAGNPNINSRQQNAARLAEEAAIQEQILALTAIFNNEVVQEYQIRLTQIKAREEKSKAEGLHLEKRYEDLKEALRVAYDRKLIDQAIDVNGKIADATGDTYRAIENQYTSDLMKYQDMWLQKKITAEEYIKAIEEAQRKADKSGSQTTGSKETDETLDKMTGLVNATHSGTAALISQIGAAFGPIGNLIAGLINLFAQTPEEFKKFVDALLETMRTLPMYLIADIPYFVEAVIASLPRIASALIGAVFNVRFYVDFVKALYRGIVEAFKSFFTGEAFKNSIAGAANTTGRVLNQTQAKFGSDDPNAGNGEFKIKDVQLASQRKATQQFEDSFQETVSEGGKTFVDMLKEAFQQIFDTLGEWGTKIWEGLAAAAGRILEWGKMIWDAFWQSVMTMADSILWLGRRIWNGFWGAVMDALNDILFIGRRIWLGFLSAIGYDAAVDFGKKMVDGIKAGFESIWDFFGEIGKKIANGFNDAVGGAGGGGIGGLGGLIDKLPGGKALTGTIGAVTGAVHSVTSAFGFNKGGYVHAGLSNPSLARAFVSMGAMQFADGGKVPGSGFSDTVPAVLTPGETVLRRDHPVSNNTTMNFTFNVEAGAVLDKDAVQRAMPLILEQIKRESNRGTNILRPAGVY